MKRSHALLLGLAAAGAGALVARAAVRRARAYDFTDKVVLITGGSRGLGLVLGRALLDRGCRLALCARDAEELDRAQLDLFDHGGRVHTVVCDLTDQAEVEAMVDNVRGHFSRVDVLINNAGLIQVGPLEEQTFGDFDEAMKTHFWAPLWATMKVLPEMRQRGEGRIVNISSIGGKVAVPHLLPYSASKFALVGLSQGLRAELLKDNIFVTTICPGLMRTGSVANALFKGQHRAEQTWFGISDALPLLTISAEAAAESIIDACEFGEAERILSLPAKLGVLANQLFPGLVTEIAGQIVNRLLPGPGGIGTEARRGSDSESPLSPSVLTTLNDRAAVRNNEVGADRA